MTKKLIEAALPLDIINDESAYDKMPGIGAHPKGLHHWWARLPLPAARAVLFASLVDDPSARPSEFPTLEDCQQERERLFGIIRRLCSKKAHLHQEVFDEANAEIKRQCGGELPTVHDPFSGGGSVPLEGLRLGLNVVAADLNPVAVMINKSMLELLPSFATQRPINPKDQTGTRTWHRAQGLAADVRYYGRKINEEAKTRIGKLYPSVSIETSKGKFQDLQIITWLWARTATCPNPGCGCQMPLMKSFALRGKKTNPISVRPIIKHHGTSNEVAGFEIYNGLPERKATVTKKGGECVACGNPVTLKYLRSEGRAKRLGACLVAYSTEAPKTSGRGVGRGKVYWPPTPEQEALAKTAQPTWAPTQLLATHPQYMAAPRYGLTEFKDLFTARQLLALNTFSDLIRETYEEISQRHSPEYARALATFLYFAVDRLADFNCSLSTWKASGEQQMQLLRRGAVPISWDYAEANVLGGKAISWLSSVDIAAAALETVLPTDHIPQLVIQKNAEQADERLANLIVSTDPPYYNNIPYSDVSDFFYVWMKHNLGPLYPGLFDTIVTPKREELVANELRFDGDKQLAKQHFEGGFTRVFSNLKTKLDLRFPVTIYYAYKQEEEEEAPRSKKAKADAEEDINLTTGWETMLEALVSLEGGYQITATWPISASQKWRLRSMKSNALASYIVLTCRPRPDDAPTATRRIYVQQLQRELPATIAILQASNLAPVDLAQAAIGPGMAIYSRYRQVVEQDGSPMRVKAALAIINKTLDEILTEQESDFDAETRWALAWYADHQFEGGDFGEANQLAGSKNTAVNALAQAGIVRSGTGRVKLLNRDELPDDWDPTHDGRTVVWEMTQHLIKRLQNKGEEGAARLYRLLDGRASAARELAYGLFTLCERKGWSQEALAYNSLVLAWNGILVQAQQLPQAEAGEQGKLDF